jgi:N4-gp56 family major capsid protein
MSVTTTATSNFSSTVVNLVTKAIVENLRARHVHAMPGNFIEANSGQGFNGTFVYTTYADGSVQTTALTEGTAPTAQALTISTESFSATQLGGVYELSDLTVAESPHDLIAVAADHAAEQAAKTIDINTREIISAGSSVIYASTATSRATVASTMVLTGALVKRLVTELEVNNVQRFPDGFYRMIIHPRQKYDLLTDTANGGWIDSFRYTNESGGPLSRWEVGTYGGMRFFVSSDAKTFATAGVSSANVYAGLAFGEGAYTLGYVQTLNAYFTPPGGDHSDPIAQKAQLGWKCMFGAKLLTGAGAKLIRVETGATNG